MKKRVLFVDDEGRVLEGLKRSLHRQAERWEMVFAEGGAAALAALGRDRFDVMVTDMQMPGMDGAQLLKLAHDSYPWMVRIVLSGQTDAGTALRAAGVAHQFLVKPFESQALVELITRTCAIQDLLGNDQLRVIVSSLDSLPLVPSVYTELTGALADPNVTIDRIGGIAARDPALSAKVLQLVNSSFFGVGREITTLNDAVRYLGTSALRSLALSVGVFRQIDTQRLPSGYSVEREIEHAVYTARIAAKLAPDRKSADAAFMAGLLHDIGKLIIATNLPEEHERITRVIRDTGKSPWVAEAEILDGVSHADVGGYLLAIWGVPFPTVEAVLLHHAPSRAHSMRFDLVGAVHVADAFTEMITAGIALDAGHQPQVDEDYLRDVGKEHELQTWAGLVESVCRS